LHTITLKSNSDFLNILNSLQSTLGESRSEIIRKAVTYYSEVVEKEKLKREFKNASKLVREHSLKENRSMEETLNDGI